jgi:hypothetical protein
VATAVAGVVVVTSVAVAALTLVVAEEVSALVVLAAGTSEAGAALMRRTQPSEERPTVEAESGSALIILRR